MHSAGRGKGTNEGERKDKVMYALLVILDFMRLTALEII